MLIAIVTGVVLLVLWGNLPQYGGTSNVSSVETSHSDTSRVFDGKYITFKYSNLYATKPIVKSDELERVRLVANTKYDKRIEVFVKSLPKGGLDDDGNYLLRKNDRTRYTKRLASINGISHDVWVSTNSPEQTVVLANNDKYVIITLVSTGEDLGLTEEMNNLLRSLTWK